MSEPIEDVGQDLRRLGRKAEKQTSRDLRNLGLKSPKEDSAAATPGKPPSIDREGATAAERERDRLRRRRGRGSTMLAGGSPDGTGVQNLGTRMLLGS